MRLFLLVLGYWLASFVPVHAAAPPGERPLSPDLALIPADTSQFLSIQPAALLTGEPGRDLRQASRITTMGLRDWIDRASLATGGVPLAELERISLIVTPAGVAWMFTATRSVDVRAVLAAAGIKAPALRRHGYRFHVGADSAAAFVGERTFLLGPVRGLEGVLAAKAGQGRASESLVRSLRDAERYHLVYGGNTHGWGDLLAALTGIDPGSRALATLTSAQIFLHFGRTCAVSVHGTFQTEAAAQQARKKIAAGQDWLLRHLDELGEILAERFVPIGGSRLARDVLVFFRAAGPTLRDTRIAQEGKVISSTLTLPGRGALWAIAMVVMPVTRFQAFDSPPPEVLKPIP